MTIQRAGDGSGFLGDFEHIQPNDVMLLEPQQMHVLKQITRLARAAATPLQRLEHALYPLVSFVVMPVFALANAGISLTSISHGIYHVALYYHPGL
jgi:NhaA family Na+:H+ antiporter